MRTRLLLGPALALLLVASACGGGDDGGSADAGSDGGDAPDTTEAAEAPANPDGDFFLVRWYTGGDNPPANEPEGLATTRLWALSPSCDDDEPCDVDVTGAGEGGSYDPEEFGEPEDVPDDITLEWDEDDETWSYEEELGPYGSCLDAEGNYADPDFTTMDEVDTVELSWDDSGERLVGTRTEEYTLNDTGRANPDCEDGGWSATYDMVLIPQDAVDDGAGDEVELADAYYQSREVYSVEGTDAIAQYDWRVNDEVTEGSGSCDGDGCDDARLSIPIIAGPPIELELDRDGDHLTATGTSVDSCSSNESIAAGQPEVLIDEGYEAEWDLELTPVTLDEDGHQALVAHGDMTATPTDEAASQFPDDCGSTEEIGAYYYLIPSDLVPS